MSQDDQDYDVGYGKPPKASRFSKGQSGNPKGRPKGAKGFIASLKRELDAKVLVREGNSSVYISKAEAMAKRLMERALKGDMVALRIIVTIDSTPPDLADSANPDQSSDTAPDRTDEAVLAHFIKRIQTGQGAPDDGRLANETD